MEDFKKIDSFFNGEKTFFKKRKENPSRRERALRFAKLALPSAAALLIGSVLILPALKDHPVIQGLDLTLPQKGELEKLHIEQTVFSFTDKDNKIGTFTADFIDETEEGSQVLKMINPKGQIPTEDHKMILADAQTGFYDQQNSTFLAQNKVKAVYDQDTTILTEEALYDFQKAYGKGNQKVYAFGPWGKLWADRFEFDKTQNLLILKGNVKIKNNARTLWADREVRYYQNENRAEAEGKVKIVEGSNTLHADKLTAYFQEGSTQELKKAEAFGHVQIHTPKGSALGDYGLYLPAQNELELQHNVSVLQDDNVITGDRAVTNLKTSVSRILKSNHIQKRVSGVIRGNTIKGQKHEK